MALTLEPEGMARHQGVVPAEGASLAEALERYFARSEQLPTRFWLAADAESAAGLMLQAMPKGEPPDPDRWRRVEALAATVRGDELLRLDAGALLRRLFHEEPLRLFDPTPVAFRCGCSRERVAELMRGLGRAEVEGVLAAEGEVVAECAFCGRRHRLDAVDVEAVLSGAAPPPGGAH